MIRLSFTIEQKGGAVEVHGAGLGTLRNCSEQEVSLASTIMEAIHAALNKRQPDPESVLVIKLEGKK